MIAHRREQYGVRSHGKLASHSALVVEYLVQWFFASSVHYFPLFLWFKSLFISDVRGSLSQNFCTSLWDVANLWAIERRDANLLSFLLPIPLLASWSWSWHCRPFSAGKTFFLFWPPLLFSLTRHITTQSWVRRLQCTLHGYGFVFSFPLTPCTFFL